MIITFKSSAYANITMFGDVAMELLEMMGFGNTVPGAIGAADVARALQNLEQALRALPREPQAAPGAESEDDEDEPEIDLHTRAMPLLELLRASAAEQKAVRWE